jgi:Domain of unknown function (DUF5666)
MRSFPKRSWVRLLATATAIITFSLILFMPVAAQDTMSSASVTLIDAGTILVLEGPVTTVNINIITIYNFDIEVAAENPILTVIKIGDFVHIEGEAASTGVIVATVVTLTTADVSVNGQVTAINDNLVVVSGTTVQFEPDDPALTLIKIGDVLNIDGNFQGSGTTLVFIVINVTIVNNNVTIINNLPSNCKVSKNGHIKCSKKH